MANSDNPFGFRPIGRLGGGPLGVTMYGKAAADANAIYSFDMVGHLTGGTPFALPENSNYKLSRVQDSSQLTPGTSLFLGASLSYGAASTGSVHPVTDAIDVVYSSQVTGASTSITTATHVGKNALVLLAAGSSVTKQSKQGIDASNIATTSSYDLRIQRIAMIPPNAEGAYAICEVTINKHALGQGTTAA